MHNALDFDVFESEVILPIQMTRGARDDGDTSGPRALMLAILKDATLCIERGRRRRHWRTRQLAAETEMWVRSDSREWLFSFASICDVLGIDTNALRDRLLTKVGRPSGGGQAARAEADALPPRGIASAHLRPRREGTRGSIALDAAGA